MCLLCLIALGFAMQALCDACRPVWIVGTGLILFSQICGSGLVSPRVPAPTTIEVAAGAVMSVQACGAASFVRHDSIWTYQRIMGNVSAV